MTADQAVGNAATGVNTASQGLPEQQTNSQTPPPAPAITNYTDGYAYEVPRPFLTLQQAAAVLGKSLRSLERSLLGRWGNKLPEGWAARKIRIGGIDEWRILPPQGFRVKVSQGNGEGSDEVLLDEQIENEPNQVVGTPAANPASASVSHNQPQSVPRRKSYKTDRHNLDQTTIVIDRTEEVENLLRELLGTQKALSEERRLHMEDLRMITQLQSSLRLLEVNAAEQARARNELESTKQELAELKERYNHMMRKPWWKKLFSSQS